MTRVPPSRTGSVGDHGRIRRNEDYLPGLLPQPRWWRIDGEPVPVHGTETFGTTDPIDEQWSSLSDLDPGSLPEEGYVLAIRPTGRILGAAPSQAGLRHAQASLVQLRNHYGENLPPLRLRDWPHLQIRGAIEGFYGRPWTHRTRLDHLRFAASVKLNSYIYAPKDDHYHRALWREPYPPRDLARIAELARTATALGIRLTYALAPGLSMKYSDDHEHHLLVAKAEQLRSVGVRSFALLFDDVPAVFPHEEDARKYGTHEGATGTAHGEVAMGFQSRFLRRRSLPPSILVAPTDYAGIATSPYRENLAASLPAEALIWWTGPDVVVERITAQELSAAAASYRRPVVLWDNFPVNDFDQTRLFLGPPTGRDPAMDTTYLQGISANPMIQGAASKIPLASIADWAWNPHAYDPAQSASAALPLIAPRDAPGLAPLVAASSSWPPSAPHARTTELIESALGGRTSAIIELRRHFRKLRRTPHQLDSSLLREDLGPWIAAAQDTGAVGVRACDLLLQGRASPVQIADLRELLARAEGHYANVSRPIVAALARAVIDMFEDPDPRTFRGPRVNVLHDGTGPGDHELLDTLADMGIDRAAEGDPGTALTIVTRSATFLQASRARTVTHPLLAWGHLDELRLARTKGVMFNQTSIEITDSAHLLSNGRQGTLTIYRGAGRITWCEPTPDAQIVARSAPPDDGEPPRPVLVHYPAGSTLTDGSRAPGDRTAYFLGPDGPAPWLISPVGRTLLEDTIRSLIALR